MFDQLFGYKNFTMMLEVQSVVLVKKYSRQKYTAHSKSPWRLNGDFECATCDIYRIFKNYI